MTKSKILAMVAVAAMIVVALSGCFGCGGNSIVGTWEVIQTGVNGELEYVDLEISGGEPMIYVFNDDGTGFISFLGFEDEFEWSVSGNELTITSEVAGAEVSQIRFNGDRIYMTVNQVGGDGANLETTAVLSRVNGDVTRVNDTDVGGTTVQEPLVFELNESAMEVVGRWELYGHEADGEFTSMVDMFEEAGFPGMESIYTFNDDGTGYVLMLGNEMPFTWAADGGALSMAGEGMGIESADLRIEGDRLYMAFDTGATVLRRLD